jgi:hypothetical protein
MNSGIGKLGQQVDAKVNVIGATNAREVIRNAGDHARLVGSQRICLSGGGKRKYFEDDEYSFGVKDARTNQYPTHHAAFMYAASRWIRIQWSLLARDSHTPIVDLEVPDTIYGDTDSKLLEQARCDKVPKELIGATVGAFMPELPVSALSRPFFQIEAEKVCQAPFTAVVGGIMTSKKYFVYGINDKGAGKLKFKCNGLTQFDESRHPCPPHGQIRCATCDCSHGQKAFQCFPCVVRLLVSERSPDAADEEARTVVTSPLLGGYKYDYAKLASLTLLDFCRVLFTGSSAVVVRQTFERTLSLPTSKLPPFTIQTRDQSRSLNRPVTLASDDAMIADRPIGGTRLGSVVVGVKEHRPGVLLPSGNYLLSQNVG